MRYLLSGVAMIVAGASGQFVLKGTNSAIALIVLGIVLVLFGLWKARPGLEITRRDSGLQQEAQFAVAGTRAVTAAPTELLRDCSHCGQWVPARDVACAHCGATLYPARYEGGEWRIDRQGYPYRWDPTRNAWEPLGSNPGPS